MHAAGSIGTCSDGCFIHTTLSALLVPDIANSVSQIFLPCLKIFQDILRQNWPENIGQRPKSLNRKCSAIVNNEPHLLYKSSIIPIIFSALPGRRIIFLCWPKPNQTEEKNCNTSVSMNSDIVHPAIDSVA